MRQDRRIARTMTDQDPSQKTISIITPCYNEQDNVRNLYNQVREVMLGVGKYRYEHIFIDNSSKDATVAILREIAAEDPNVTSAPRSTRFSRLAATP
jgi:polyisoprenyl-phosphate glycosyltransferase